MKVIGMNMDDVLYEAMRPAHTPPQELNQAILRRYERERDIKQQERKMEPEQAESSIVMAKTDNAEIAGAKELRKKGKGTKRKGTVIWKLALAACLAVGIIVPVSIHAYDSLFKPKIEVNLPEGKPRTFYVYMTEEAENNPEYWQRIIHSDLCEDYMVYKMQGNGYINVKVEDMNPDYMEYIKNDSPAIYDRIMETGYGQIGVDFYTYEGCNSYVLSEGLTQVTPNSDEFNYKGDARLSYTAGTTVQMEVYIPYEPEDPEQTIPNTDHFEFVLDDYTIAREWYMEQMSMPYQLCLSIPYDEFDQYWPPEYGENLGHEYAAMNLYVVKAKEGKGQEFRDEVNTILGKKGRTFEADFLE